MRQTILIFAALITALLILFQLSSYSLWRATSTTEYVIAGIAVVFFFVGAWIQKKWARKPTPSQVDQKKISQLELTNREIEVMQLICTGLSNKEIADTLFVSESTVKTHVSNLYLKMDVRRRTQLITKATALNLIPSADN